jgi:hypothetical protein
MGLNRLILFLKEFTLFSQGRWQISASSAAQIINTLYNLLILQSLIILYPMARLKNNSSLRIIYGKMNPAFIYCTVYLIWYY